MLHLSKHSSSLLIQMVNKQTFSLSMYLIISTLLPSNQSLRASPTRQASMTSSHTRTVESSVRTVEASIRTAESSMSTIDPIPYDPHHHNCHIYSPQTVFLKTPTCRYAPYRLTTAQVFPGVSLILLSQVGIS